MDSAVASTPPALDAKTLLARINQRIVLLRTWLSHDHNDEPYWWARNTTARRVQSERDVLRRVADLLHVERATSRGRLHGTRFANLDAQRAWIPQQQRSIFSGAWDYAHALLREGKLQI